MTSRPAPSNGISSIPGDVLASMIFVRLPAGSLLAVRLVCKSWYSLTTSPCFVLGHARRPARTGIVFVPDEKTARTPYRHVILNEGGALARTLELPRKLLEYAGGISKLSLSASCDGLLCLDHWGQYNNGSGRRRRMGYVVCNPVTKDWLPVPAGSVMSYGGKSNFIAGFYFHSPTGEHRLLQQCSKISTGDGYRIEISTVYGYEVFGIGGPASSGAWRPIHAPTFSPSSSQPDRSFSSSSLDRSRLSASSTVLHGSIHFLLSSEGDPPPPRDFIVAFDTSTEEFRKMPLPPRLRLEGCYNSLMVMGGGTRLGFSQAKSFPPPPPRDEMDVWSLEDYGRGEWVKQYRVPLRDMYHSISIFTPYSPLYLLWEEEEEGGWGKELLLKYGGWFVLYDLESKTFKKELEIRKGYLGNWRDMPSSLWNWLPHKESLVPCNSSSSLKLKIKM